MNRRAGLSLALALAVTLSAVNAYGFVVCVSDGSYKPVAQLSGSDVIVKWTAADRPVGFKVNATGLPSGSEATIETALAEWTGVSSSDFVFTYDGTSTSSAFGVVDGVNLVDYGPLSAGQVGLTKAWFYTSAANEGQMIDTDIRLASATTWFNNANPYPAGNTDVQSVITHELGHTLCLGHSTSTGATMFYATVSGGGNTSQRSLHSDDVAGITYLYPAAGNSAPTAPALEYPSNSQTGVSQALTFTWKAALDPDGDTLKYDISYCENQSFSGCSSHTVTSASTGASAGPALPFAAKFGKGVGLYAAALSAFGLLLATGLRRKKTKALAISVALVATVALLSCGGGGGGDDGDSGNGGSGSTTSYSVSGLKAATKYYWKVAANDSKGGVAESSVWSFTTQ